MGKGIGFPSELTEGEREKRWLQSQSDDALEYEYKRTKDIREQHSSELEVVQLCNDRVKVIEEILKHRRAIATMERIK